MNINNARALAEKFLLEEMASPTNKYQFAIVDSEIIEEEDGWYFPFQTEKYIITGNLDFSVVGNWPIFVTKDGRVGQRRFGMPFIEGNKL